MSMLIVSSELRFHFHNTLNYLFFCLVFASCELYFDNLSFHAVNHWPVITEMEESLGVTNSKRRKIIKTHATSLWTRWLLAHLLALKSKARWYLNKRIRSCNVAFDNGYKEQIKKEVTLHLRDSNVGHKTGWSAERLERANLQIKEDK